MTGTRLDGAVFSVIRWEEEADHEAIFRVHEGCFPTGGEAKLVEALRADELLVASIVAVEQEDIVGHVAFSPVHIDSFVIGVGLGPVAVLEDYRRRGLAEKMIQMGLETCRGLAYANAVVLGDPSYYARFGFRRAADFDLEDTFGGGDAFQAMELRPGGMPPRGGTVSYAPPFSQLD